MHQLSTKDQVWFKSLVTSRTHFVPGSFCGWASPRTGCSHSAKILSELYISLSPLSRCPGQTSDVLRTDLLAVHLLGDGVRHHPFRMADISEITILGLKWSRCLPRRETCEWCWASVCTGHMVFLLKCFSFGDWPRCVANGLASDHWLTADKNATIAWPLYHGRSHTEMLKGPQSFFKGTQTTLTMQVKKINHSSSTSCNLHVTINTQV